MATNDLSRSATDFRKHYTSVRAQQGRVFVDDDHNENERLHNEDERRTRADIIGPAGSPDGGFLISDPKVTKGRVDFDINPGTFYLGGLRLELEQLETYQVQSDWLQLDGAPLPPQTGFRTDLVYVQAWLQPVSAVEDRELFEVALGGPDTSTRMRLMRRVRVREGVANSNCQQNWQALKDFWAAEGLGALDDENRLVPDTVLKIDFEPGGDPADLCTPPVAGGFLGAENQAIRVQLRDATHFTWGFDNAAPLYRVLVKTNGAGQRRVIEMVNEPKDQAHWPAAGQAVELLPWSAVLPNNEKLSERTGWMGRVDASFNPDTKQFTIDASVPNGYGEAWKNRPDAAALGDGYHYLRVWNRGADTLSPLDIPFTTGTPVALGQTGLTITFGGSDRRPGDHWIIAARPESPDRVVPWQLEQGRWPHGFRYFYAPLAVIQWDATGASPVGTVIDDCRPTFPPLTRLHNCCTHTVGDGKISHGHFSSIQEAINHIPPEGGTVCILPGNYFENILLRNRAGITIHGCGRWTVLSDRGDAENPVIRVEDSSFITIKNLSIHCQEVTGISLLSTKTEPDAPGQLQEIDLEDLFMRGRDRGAIVCRGGRFIRLRRNRILIETLIGTLGEPAGAGLSPTVFVRADDVLVEENELICEMEMRLTSALGGLQLGGGSERVEVRRNRITGGNGNGITLGSISYILPRNIELLQTDYAAAFEGGLAEYYGDWIYIDPNGCPQPDPDPGGPSNPEGGGPMFPVSDGNLYQIRIVDNDISDMGLSGIAARRHPLPFGGISANELSIESNRIYHCVQLDLGDDPFAANKFLGYGGIALSYTQYLTVRDNLIEGNGRSFVDPICGVYVRHAFGALVTQNYIAENGPRTGSPKLPTPGPRGGIFFDYAAPPFTKSRYHGPLMERHENSPALLCDDNVISVPVGPALSVMADGVVSVEGNQLGSNGLEVVPGIAGPGDFRAALAKLGGAAVRIINVGTPQEMGGLFLGFEKLFKAMLTPLSGLGLPSPLPAGGGPVSGLPLGGGGGDVLFNDNRVLLMPPAPDDKVIVSSVLILTGDDVSASGNQCECRLAGQTLAANAFVMGWSVRVVGNRFKEQLDQKGISAYTFGHANCTTANQGTRCFVVVGHQALTVRQANRSLSDVVFSPQFCEAVIMEVRRTLTETEYDV